MADVRTISAGSLPLEGDGNKRYYERRRVGAHYARKARLDPAEAEVFRRYSADIEGKRILDLGVGGGRTTGFLIELSQYYVGVDYAPQMIDLCRRRYPKANLRVMDARDLSAFPDDSFDFILFSKAGIDAVGPQDRLAVLAEVHRTLKDGGLFVFSSHNRNTHIPKPWALSHFDVSPLRNPVRFGKRLISYPLGIVNYFRNARRNQVADEYCVVVDSGDMYSLVHYRMTPAAQKRQLERAGFRDVEAVEMDGRTLAGADWETVEDPSILYVCRAEH